MADPDPYTLPPIIKDLEQTLHVFTLHIAPGSRRGNTKLILDHAAEATPLALPAVPVHEQQPDSSTTLTIHSPQQVATEIPTTQITPPPNTDDPDEKNRYSSGTVSKIIKKQLFEETGEKPVPLEIPEAETETREHRKTRVPAEDDPLNEPEASKKAKHE